MRGFLGEKTVPKGWAVPELSGMKKNKISCTAQGAGHTPPPLPVAAPPHSPGQR